MVSQQLGNDAYAVGGDVAGGDQEVEEHREGVVGGFGVADGVEGDEAEFVVRRDGGGLY